LKKPLNRHIHISADFDRFDEIWHDDANFSKTKMAAAAILKKHKNRDITTTD